MTTVLIFYVGGETFCVTFNKFFDLCMDGWYTSSVGYGSINAFSLLSHTGMFLNMCDKDQNKHYQFLTGSCLPLLTGRCLLICL